MRCIIQLSKELIKDLSDNFDGKRKSKLVYTTAKLVLAQVNNLLDRSMMEKNLFTINRQSGNLSRLIIKTISVLKAQAQLNSISLEYMGPQHGEVVKIDKMRIQQILFNLVSNAIKFSYRYSVVTVELTDE
jgi:signal transduction histidine kinase